MPKAVRFDEYGEIDVLYVAAVERPRPGPGQVLVRIKRAGINPGEAGIREGVLDSVWPAIFRSGQGSDLAGVVEEVGEGVDGFAAGDEVAGFVNTRSSHAEFAVVEAVDLTLRPSNVSWEDADTLFVAGATVYAAVRPVSLGEGDTVVVAEAADGVGSVAVQLAKNAGAGVIGLASGAKHAWLSDHGAIPVAYGEGVAGRIREASGGKVDAFIDAFGSGYVDLALALELDVRPERINTIADFAAAEKHGASADVMAEPVGMISERKLEIPITRVYPLGEVREAYRDLAGGHPRGKIVLAP